MSVYLAFRFEFHSMSIELAAIALRELVHKNLGVVAHKVAYLSPRV
jgi:hypothetical protein